MCIQSLRELKLIVSQKTCWYLNLNIAMLRNQDMTDVGYVVNCILVQPVFHLWLYPWISSFLNGTPPLTLNRVQITLGNSPVTFQAMGRSYFPDWCFRLGNSSKGRKVCSHTRINFSMSSDHSTVFNTSNCALNHTIYTFIHTPDPHTEIAKLLSQLALAGFSEGTQQILNRQPLTLGNSTYICCGRTYYTWIPSDPQG